VEEFAEVLRKWSLQIDPRAGTRLRETELRGVQEIAAQGSQRALADLELRRCTVERVANNWMSQRGEMHANLVRASGVKLNFGEGCIVDARDGAPIGARFAGVAQHDAAASAHPRAISGVARYGQLDTAAGFLEMAFEERQVGLLHLALPKGFAKFRVRGIVFRYQNDTRRAFVETMHDARTKGIAALRQRLPAAEQRVHQRTAGIAGTCVHGHAGRLVDGQNVVVFIENIERNRFGFSAQRRTRPNFDGNVFAAPQTMRAFCRT